MSNLIDIIQQAITQIPEYKSMSWENRNVLESYVIMGEILNPKNSYEYSKQGEGVWTFTDSDGNEYFVRIVYQPTSNPYMEIKHGWVDEPRYERNIRSEIDFRRSDTIAKIYEDEIIPFFMKQQLTNLMVLKPLDIKRYKFSERLIQKLTPKDLQKSFDESNLTITIQK